CSKALIRYSSDAFFRLLPWLFSKASRQNAAATEKSADVPIEPQTLAEELESKCRDAHRHHSTFEAAPSPPIPLPVPGKHPPRKRIWHSPRGGHHYDVMESARDIIKFESRQN